MLDRHGPRHEKETVIRFSEGEPDADIGTASNSFLQKLIKKGFVPIALGQRWAQFRVPKKLVSIRKPRSQASEA
jgi:hypothetical protein